LPITAWFDQLTTTGYTAGVALEFQSQADNPFAIDEKESR
jgi:hypothetical protein